MTIKKIADPPELCTSPGHNPPSHISLPAGTYEHTCDVCGHKTTFIVNAIIAGLEDAIAWSRGDQSRGTVTHVLVEKEAEED